MPLWERDILNDQASRFLPSILPGVAHGIVPDTGGVVDAAVLPGVDAVVVDTRHG